MTIKLIAQLSVTAVLATALLTASAADAASGATQTSQDVQQGVLELDATFEGRAVLGEPVLVLLSVRNVGTSPLTVQSLKLQAVGLLSRIYTQPCDETFSEQTIQPQQRVNGTCSLVSMGIPKEIFLYRQDRYQVLAKVKVASRTDPLPMTLTIRLAMPESSVIYGALIGAMLLVIFSTSFSYLQTLPEAPKDFSDLKNQAATYLARLPIRFLLSAVEMLLRAIQGGVVAIILIVFSRTTTEISAPIAVRVDDFWGGLLVGIFSVPLARWLATKLESSEKRTFVGAEKDQDAGTKLSSRP